MTDENNNEEPTKTFPLVPYQRYSLPGIGKTPNPTIALPRALDIITVVTTLKESTVMVSTLTHPKPPNIIHGCDSFHQDWEYKGQDGVVIIDDPQSNYKLSPEARKKLLGFKVVIADGVEKTKALQDTVNEANVEFKKFAQATQPRCCGSCESSLTCDCGEGPPEEVSFQTEYQQTPYVSEAEDSFDCPGCDGEGVIDSGGFTPWDTPIDVPCPECSPIDNDDAVVVGEAQPLPSCSACDGSTCTVPCLGCGRTVDVVEGEDGGK